MTDLGVGLVWWPALDPLCRESEGLVDVVEAEPETFWVPRSDGGGFRSYLAPALGHLAQPKLLHGVGAPLGGTGSADVEHAATFRRDIAGVKPEFVSEHLSFARFAAADGGSACAGFLLPPAQSAAGVAVAVANIRRRRALLGPTPLAVENTASYLPRAPGEWPDGDYVAAVAEGADCGILLDLHNAYCNAGNGRGSVAAFCDALPRDRVWELHLAGGENERGFRLDSHSGVVAPELMEMAAELVPRLPALRAIVFEIMPERVAEVGLAAVGRQLAAMHDLWNRRDRGAAPSAPDRPRPATEMALDPGAWERLLGRAVTAAAPPIAGEADGWWRASAPAIELYRTLSQEGRASAVAGAAPNTVRLLLRTGGGGEARRLLQDFWSRSLPGYTSSEEARCFLAFLESRCPALPGLEQAIALDLAELARF